jgi:hypothetical protein
VTESAESITFRETYVRNHFLYELHVETVPVSHNIICIKSDLQFKFVFPIRHFVLSEKNVVSFKDVASICQQVCVWRDCTVVPSTHAKVRIARIYKRSTFNLIFGHAPRKCRSTQYGNQWVPINAESINVRNFNGGCLNPLRGRSLNPPKRLESRVKITTAVNTASTRRHPGNPLWYHWEGCASLGSRTLWERGSRSSCPWTFAICQP